MGDPSSRAPLAAKAFAEVLEATQGGVLAFVRHLIGSSDDARDVVQDVYVQAWRAAQKGTPPFPPEALASDGGLDLAGVRRWLYHVAYRQAITWLRHRAVIPWESLDREEVEVLVVAPLGQAAAEPFEDRIAEKTVLQAALARLRPDDAACLMLATVQGFTTAEVAQILGVAPDAARKRLSRAMERLRTAYFAPEAGLAHERKGSVS